MKINKSKVARGILYAVVFVFAVICTIVGRFLYFLSKALLVLGHAIMLNKYTVRDELRNFWRVRVSIGDAL